MADFLLSEDGTEDLGFGVTAAGAGFGVGAGFGAGFFAGAATAFFGPDSLGAAFLAGGAFFGADFLAAWGFCFFCLAMIDRMGFSKIKGYDFNASAQRGQTSA